MTIDIGVLIGVLGTSTGIIIALLNYRRNSTKDIQDSASGNGELRSDIGYIKRGVDDIRLDLRAQEKRVGEIAEKVIRLEESTKSAHKRIDGLEEK